MEDMVAGAIVDWPENKNVINLTWAFKLKHFLDGLVKKFKAKFCARDSFSLRPKLQVYNGQQFVYSSF